VLRVLILSLSFATFLLNHFHPYNMPLSASPLSTIAILFLSYLADRITHGIIARKRFNVFAQQHGCEAPLDVTGPLPFKSWAFVWRLM
jgi:hypothetical protein